MCVCMYMYKYRREGVEFNWRNKGSVTAEFVEGCGKGKGATNFLVGINRVFAFSDKEPWQHPPPKDFLFQLFIDYIILGIPYSTSSL